MKKILFVCVENSNRSQMAEAFARVYGEGKVAAFSAGSRPGGVVNARAVAAMREVGYDLGTHASKGLEAVRGEAPFDAVVTMGCGDACPWMPAGRHVDWLIRDPRNMDREDFNRVRDEIAMMVRALVGEMV